MWINLYCVFYIDEADHTYERMQYIRHATFEILTTGLHKTEVSNLYIRLTTKLAACHMHGRQYIHALPNRKTVTMACIDTDLLNR
jgi:hypothetical protein